MDGLGGYDLVVVLCYPTSKYPVYKCHHLPIIPCMAWTLA